MACCPRFQGPAAVATALRSACTCCITTASLYNIDGNFTSATGLREMNPCPSAELQLDNLLCCGLFARAVFLCAALVVPMTVLTNPLLCLWSILSRCWRPGIRRDAGGHGRFVGDVSPSSGGIGAPSRRRGNFCSR